MHGTGDDNVHSQNTVQLTEAFIKAGKQVDTFYYPGRRHGISRGNARAHVYQKMFVYFKENL
jgi:dipeptidyl-peptidase-4